MAVKDVTIRFKTQDKDLDRSKSKFDDINQSANKATGSVKNLEKDTKKSFKSMENSIKSVGTALIGAFAVQQVIGDATRRVREFDQAMADLQAITGASNKEIAQFEKEVLKVSKNTGKGASDIAKAFQLVGSAQPELLKSADALGMVTEQAVILAQAGGLEVSQAADALTKSMNQFGASSEDAAMFADILATAQQKGTSTILQTSEALKNAGANANAAGLSFEETNVAIQALAKGGLLGSEAGTGLSSALIKLSTQADDKINPSLNSLQDVVNELANRNLTLADASKLVGAESAKTLLTLISQKDVVTELTGELNEQGNAMKQAETITETLNGKMERLDSAYERVILQIENGDGAISKMIGQYTDATTNVLGFIEALESGEGVLESLINIGQDFAVSQGILTEEQAEQNALLVKNSEILQRVEKDKSALNEISTEELKQLMALGILKNKELNLEARRIIIKREQQKEQEKLNKAIEAEKEANEKAAKANELTDKEKEKAAKKAEERAKLLEEEARELRDVQIALMEDGAKKEIAIINAKFDDRIAKTIEKYGEETEIIKELEKQRASETRQVSLDLEAKRLEDEEEARQLKLEKQAEEDEAFFEAERIKFERRVEQEQAFADAKKEIDQQLAFSALGLAGAIASAAGDSQQAQLTALAFDKLAAVASIIINTQAAAAQAVSPLGGLGPVLGQALVPKIIASGALQVATVLATAIPQAKAITETKEKPAFREGVIDLAGKGTKHSDSINARLSVGESVMTSDETSEHKGLLMAIRHKKLDEYLQREYLPQFYVGQLKKKGAKEIRLGNNSQKFPKGFKVTNPSAISEPIAKAIEEQNFLNRNGWR